MKRYTKSRDSRIGKKRLYIAPPGKKAHNAISMNGDSNWSARLAKNREEEVKVERRQ